MILYEYPCNERVRSLLRVEHLFDRLFFFARGTDPHHHHVCVATLFDLLDISDRTDLRGAVLQDLERQRVALQALHQHPGVDPGTLDTMLAEIQATASEVAAQGRIGQELRDNEWLASLRGRVAVPGGSSQVDMPSYYSWQLRPIESRVRDLQRWISPFLPLYKGLALILRVLRDSGDVVDVEARQGAYQEMLGGKVVPVAPCLGRSCARYLPRDQRQQIRGMVCVSRNRIPSSSRTLLPRTFRSGWRAATL